MPSSRLVSRALGVLLAPVLVLGALAAPASSVTWTPADGFTTVTKNIGVTNIPDAPPGGCNPQQSTPVNIDFTISGIEARRVTWVGLKLKLNHTYSSDLRIDLVAPNGAVGNVFNPGCNTGGDDFNGIYVWRQDAASGISSTGNPGGVIPTGSKLPTQNLETAFAALDDANGTWTVRIWDRWSGFSGTVGPDAELTIASDETRPVTSFGTGPADGSPAGPVEFSFGATDNHSVEAFNCSLDGGPFVACSSPYQANVAPGSHVFQVQAVDTSGNVDTSPVQHTWTTAPAPDTTAPDTAITGGPADGDTVSVLPTYSFSSPDDDTVGFKCSLDNAPFTNCTSPYTVPDGTAPGQHTFTVFALDEAGNEDQSRPSRTFTYDPTPDDTTPPQTNITSGPENGAGVKSPPTYGFGSPDADADGFVCSVDGKAFQPCTSPFKVSGIAPGNHSFEVSAVDEAGNVDPTPAMRTFKLRDLCAEAKFKLKRAQQKLRAAIRDGAAPSKIRRLRAQVKKWKGEVRDFC